jgi:hypothetical protein
LRTCFRQEGETCFRTRFPAEPTETFAHGFFAKAEPAGNPTIAHLLGFEAENGAVSLMEFLVHGRTDYRPSPRAREGAQSTDFQTLLIAAKCAGRVAEAACDIILIRVSRLEKLNHGVGFGRTILNRVMGEDDAMDEEDSLALLGLNTNAIVYEDGTGGRSWVGKKLFLRYSRAHGFLACSISTDSKSGQIKVRTPLKEKPSQLRSPGMCRRGVEHFQSKKCSNQNRAISIRRFRKSGQFRVRTPISKNLNSGRFLGGMSGDLRLWFC